MAAMTIMGSKKKGKAAVKKNRTLLTILMDMYVRDTTNDGQKFCGCRPDECNCYNNGDACRRCLREILTEKRDGKK